MGHVERRPNGRWRARYRTPDGQSRSRVFDRKLDADRFLREVEHSKDVGGYIDPAAGRVTLRTYVAEHVARQPWRTRTRLAADTSLAHALAAFGDYPLSGIRPSDVQAFVSGMQLAPVTVRTVVQHLRTVLRSAVRDGLIVRDPSIGVKLPSVTTGAVVPPTDETVQAIYGAAAPPFRAAIVLGAGVGLRAAEAAGLTVDRIDWLRRTVRVDRQWAQGGGWAPPKTQASDRTVPVAEEVLQLLARHLERFGSGDEGALVHWPHAGNDGPLSHAAWGRAMRLAVEGVELSEVRYHDLRHHFASKLINAGCSVKAVQSALGHEKASTTLDVYGHLWPGDDDRIRAAIGAAWRAPASPARHADG